MKTLSLDEKRIFGLQIKGHKKTRRGKMKYSAKVKIEIYPKGTRNNKIKVARITITGNVGSDGRAILDDLNMTSVNNIANSREYWSSIESELQTVRRGLINRLPMVGVDLEAGK